MQKKRNEFTHFGNDTVGVISKLYWITEAQLHNTPKYEDGCSTKLQKVFRISCYIVFLFLVRQKTKQRSSDGPM